MAYVNDHIVMGKLEYTIQGPMSSVDIHTFVCLHICEHTFNITHQNTHVNTYIFIYIKTKT